MLKGGENADMNHGVLADRENLTRTRTLELLAGECQTKSIGLRVLGKAKSTGPSALGRYRFSCSQKGRDSKE